VTSTAETVRIADPRRRTGAGLLGILCLILLGQLLTPEPWMVLWPVLPVVGAAALLLSQTPYPLLGWLLPLGAISAVFALGAQGQTWGWCLAAGSVAAALLGLAERQGQSLERRAWAYLPVFALAAVIPLAPGYAQFIGAAADAIKSEEGRQLAVLQSTPMAADQKVAAEQLIASGIQFGLLLAQNVLPMFLFVWVALLVHLAERLARRLADLVRRPLTGNFPFEQLRLPDGMVWLLVVGILLVVVRDPRTVPVGVNLAGSVALAFALQGLSVVKVYLVTHGMTPGLIALLFLFTLLTMWPILPLACAAVGLMDLWLDFRRLEPRAEGEEPEGGNLWK
jgi:uncharacterized membrane protein YjjB (DUF3815 family)